MDDTLIGRKIGSFEILEKIGQGGMAEVYKGRQPALRRMVAIKLLGRSLQADASLTERFQREAQAVAALRHPNIVQVHDFGVFKGGHYLVMEYIEGRDLRQMMDERFEKGETFSKDEILPLLSQVAAALDYAHGKGIIHRDIKPGNILVASEGQAILSDFGLVMLQNRVSQVTEGHTFGTPEYIAPEQAMDSRAAVPQSDIYALGGILYEMVTGRLLFEADTAISLALMHINEEVTPPRKYNPELPQAVEEVIMRALSKEPARRYATASEMIEALRRAWHDQPQESAAGAPPPPPSEGQGAEDGRFGFGRQSWMWAVLGVVLVGLVVLGYALLSGGALPLIGALAAPTETPTSTPTLAPTATATSTSVPATATPTPTPTSALISAASAAPTSTPSPMPSPTPTPAPTETPSPTPTPTLAPGQALTRTVDGMVMHYIPGGEFLMGAPEEDDEAYPDETPQHAVVLDPFWIDETEVTVDQYKMCVEAGACEAPYTRTQYDNPARSDHPMTYISWDQAANYCAWIAEATGWDAGLPTEAQWEFAASWEVETQSKRRYPWGDELDRARVHLEAQPRRSAATWRAPALTAYWISPATSGNGWLIGTTAIIMSGPLSPLIPPGRKAGSTRSSEAALTIRSPTSPRNCAPPTARWARQMARRIVPPRGRTWGSAAPSTASGCPRPFPSSSSSSVPTPAPSRSIALRSAHSFSLEVQRTFKTCRFARHLLHNLSALTLGLFTKMNRNFKEIKNQMGKVRRLVLDTLKPHDPSIVEMAKIISDIEGVGAVNVSIYEMDRKVENAKITIEGDDVPYLEIQTMIEELGGAIHSVDEVVAGKIIIDDAVTLQD